MAIDPAWIQAGSQLLGGVIRSQPAGPSISGAPVSINQDIDFSGFTVGTGGSKVTGAPNNKTFSPSNGLPAAEDGGKLLPALIVGSAAIAGFLWNR